MRATVAVIPARGKSKGIPRKNLIDICGKPLIAWSILQAQHASEIDSVWVSSDDDEILAVAESYGAMPIRRPAEISSDQSSSESAWMHALDAIEGQGVDADLVVAMQATSPIRESSDLDGGVQTFRKQSYDSLLSVTEVQDFFTWHVGDDGCAESLNYDYHNRKRRQEIKKCYLENGSFYIFQPQQLRLANNRLGGRIGMYLMGRHKMFQIDSPEDIKLCASIMRGYGMEKS